MDTHTHIGFGGEEFKIKGTWKFFLPCPHLHGQEPAHRGRASCTRHAPHQRWAGGMLRSCAASHRSWTCPILSRSESGAQTHGPGMFAGLGMVSSLGHRGPSDGAPSTTGCSDLAVCPSPRRGRKPQQGNQVHKCTLQRERVPGAGET